MRILGFIILSFYLLDCQSLSLSMNRDVAQGHCTAVVEPPTTESPESCKAPAQEKHEIAVVTVEDPSSSFFVHFRGDKKKDDFVKNFCGKPILTKKATGLDSEGIPLKKVIIKRQTPNDIIPSQVTQEDNRYQKQYEVSASAGRNILLQSDQDNVINNAEDATLALYGTGDVGHDFEFGSDNIDNPDYMTRAIAGVSTDQYGEEL